MIIQENFEAGSSPVGSANNPLKLKGNGKSSEKF